MNIVIFTTIFGPFKKKKKFRQEITNLNMDIELVDSQIELVLLESTNSISKSYLNERKKGIINDTLVPNHQIFNAERKQ